MTATRTLAIGLPDNPAATAEEFVAALRLAASNLSVSGDTWSANIVENLANCVQRGANPPATYQRPEPGTYVGGGLIACPQLDSF